MDEGTYQAIRAQWLSERDEARATVRRLTSQIRDLDRTWKKLSPGKNDSRNGPPIRALRNGTLTAKVAAAIEELPIRFESPDVWEAVARASPGVTDDRAFRANVANALANLVERGEIQLVERGAGRRPARYRRATTGKETEGGPPSKTT